MASSTEIVDKRKGAAKLDKLTKLVYLGNMQAERNAYAIAEDRPKNEPRP